MSPPQRAEELAQQSHISASYVGYKKLDGTQELPSEPNYWGDVFGEPDAARLRATGEFRFRVTNLGSEGARHIRLRLTDASGRSVGASAEQLSLAADANGEYAIKIAEPAESYAYPLQVWMSWDRPSGEPGARERASKQRVPGPP